MLAEAALIPEVAFKVKPPYQQYRDCGGNFSQTEYAIVQNALGQKHAGDGRDPALHQIQGIAGASGIPLSEQEIASYQQLRKKMPTEQERQQRQNDGTVPVWSMSDQQLVREIILATEGRGPRFDQITLTYPHIFPEDIRQMQAVL